MPVELVAPLSSKVGVPEMEVELNVTEPSARPAQLASVAVADRSGGLQAKAWHCRVKGGPGHKPSDWMAMSTVWPKLSPLITCSNASVGVVQPLPFTLISEPVAPATPCQATVTELSVVAPQMAAGAAICGMTLNKMVSAVMQP